MYLALYLELNVIIGTKLLDIFEFYDVYIRKTSLKSLTPNVVVIFEILIYFMLIDVNYVIANVMADPRVS